jgi:hypothetical protein
MSFEFRVSDSSRIPHRGHLLRLKLASGEPQMKRLKEGARLRVRGPHGEDAVVDVIGLPTMAGRQTQRRLERTREMDVVIPADQAVIEGARIEIGWMVGPPRDET